MSEASCVHVQPLHRHAEEKIFLDWASESVNRFESFVLSRSRRSVVAGLSYAEDRVKNRNGSVDESTFIVVVLDEPVYF